MRIKRLDIMGFKSFPERVQIPFSEGIAAVVGPNGCGKSNIVDAIRWVMGEQSPKQLRGRQMDDILFNGAKSNQPSGLAEVTMILSNEPGSGGGTGLGPSEIAITRRLYRSGDSEYLINKVPCRLKDITQFFMDTGMGTKAYAIIEQGRIGALVDSRPEERRLLIDEAAGITRYKAQKKEAERRIESTEQNLTHVSTLMSETKRQIGVLTRQARKAAQYKELRTELRTLDISMTAGQLAALRARREDLSSRKNELETRLAGLLAGVERMEVDLERLRLDITHRENVAEAKTAALYQLRNEYNKLKQEDEFLEQEMGRNRGRQDRLGGELARLEETRERETVDLARLREEITALTAEAEDKRSVREESQAVFTDLNLEYDLVVGRRDELGRELNGIRSRLVRLRESLVGFDRVADSQARQRDETMAEMEQLQADLAGLNEQAGVLTGRKEELEEEREASRVRAGALGEELAALRSEAERLSAEERTVNGELAGLKSRLATLKDIQTNFGWYPEGVQALMNSAEMKEAGILGPVAERLSVPKGYEAAVEAALGERLKYILVGDRRAAARALAFLKASDLGRCGFISRADLPDRAGGDLTRGLLGDYSLAENQDEAMAAGPGRVFLTREGDYFGPAGLVVGGRPQSGDRGLLAQLRDMDELGEQVAVLEERKERLTTGRDEVLTRSRSVQSMLDQARESARVADSSLNELERQLSALTGRRGGIEGRAATMARALEGQAREADRLTEQMEQAEAEIRPLEDQEQELAASLEESVERAAILDRELDEAREQAHLASMEMTALEERLSNARRSVTKAGDWIRNLESQIASKEKDRIEAGAELERLAGRRQGIARTLEGFHDRLAGAEAEANEQKKLLDQTRENLNAQENQVREARRSGNQTRDQVGKVELELQETSYRIQAHLDRIESEYRLDMDDLPEEVKASIDPGVDLEEAGQRRDELRRKIEGIGEVNLTAIGEHQALEERYTFYRTQYDDLTASIQNLKDSIHKINRTCKVRFKSTFEAVDQKVREIFPLLFEGGEAWLSLTDESDPLDSGVEIHVHPPGKRLTVMSLLSGGEKALVAIALIFALYLIKPSPFCLLDEIDAPLDEANIDRFNKLLSKLGQSSQIIMITHNKRTMQISQTLYGVTMEEAGVSKMVSVNLDYLEDINQHAKMVQAG